MHKQIKLILIKIFPVIFFVGLALMFYWKVILKGLVPFPGDLLIGAYYPWLEYKWGNIVGVAIKNTLISDIFSQFFLWKKEIWQSYSIFQWPLWNQYSYSGYPLLANFNSGALNPFNVLSLIFGLINGWSAMVLIQPVIVGLSMFTLLKTLKKSTMAALIGSTVYAYGGFSLLWSQFVNVGYSMAWIPLIIVAIELAYIKQNKKWLMLISPLFYLIVTAGHLQALVYAAVIAVVYYIYRCGLKNLSFNIYFATGCFIAIGLGAIQLLPSVELMNLSIRFGDNFAQGRNYGLLPGQNLISMIAPDFFGNPSTGNFWGFFDYHETMIYPSILGLLGLVYGIRYYKKLKWGKFFVWLAIVSLLMQFDTPLGRAVYFLKIPFLWTSVAGRINMIFLFSTSVLVAELVDDILEMKFKEKILLFLPNILIITVAGLITTFSLFLYKNSYVTQFLEPAMKNVTVGLRNLFIPTVLTFTLFVIIVLAKKLKYWKILVLLLVTIDLFRFGWKYLPLVPKGYVYPETEITNFLKSDKSVFRIEKEYGAIMPQNTWGGYELMSPSGYDPMAIQEYVQHHNKDLNNNDSPGESRFSQIEIYDALALGKYNVKYLLAIKSDEKGVVPGNNINYRIDEKEWIRVFQTPGMAVLLNNKYQDRTSIVDSNGNIAEGTTEIISFQSNKVVVKFTNINGDRLLLRDTYYPGWTATINGVQTKIGDEFKPFRTVDIREIKEGEIIFEYKPSSFRIGLIVSIVSMAVWIIIMLVHEKK